MRGAVVLAGVVLLAGCGSQPAATPKQPHLPHALGTAWRHDADAIAASLAVGDGCLAQQRTVALRAAVIAAVNARRLAPRFQEPLVSAINDLASRIRCVQQPAPAHDGHGKHKGHDEGDD